MISDINTISSYALICVDVAHAEVDRLFHYAIPVTYHYRPANGFGYPLAWVINLRLVM